MLPVLGLPAAVRHHVSGLFGHLSPAWRCVFLAAAGSLKELAQRPASSLTVEPDDEPAR